MRQFLTGRTAGWGARVAINKDVFRGLLHGLHVVNNGTTKIDFTAGVCMDENERAILMNNPATATRDLNILFGASGSGGRFSTASMVGGTWYHVFAISG